MTAHIQPLPTELVHLIAAGEVIDSLAAVVRELVENALDAGATRLTISLHPDQWRVRVADNGSGMSLSNLEQAALPHSTSKIRQASDLQRVSSLGFRGEALHSLARLANLEICSRMVDAEVGWRVCYQPEGVPDLVETVAIAPGTIVTVTDLFKALPTRRQSLPPLSQQLKAIQTTIQHIALCHPHVTWLVKQNDREWFAIWASHTAKHIIPQLLRDIQPSDLHELTLNLTQHTEAPAPLAPSAPLPSCPLYLLIGLPDRCHRYRPDWIKVAVNGRVVKVPELEQTIFAAFRRTLPRDRYPVCVLHLQLPPDQVDWNRHPAKAEIYLHQTESWQNQVKGAIEQALRLSAVDLSHTSYATAKTGNLIKVAESDGVYGSSRSIQPSSDENVPPLVTSLPPLKAVAQVHQMYILVEHPTGLWLVEQHIAHERVLYEHLCDRWQLVAIDPPITLSQLSIAQLEQLARLGIEAEPFGDDLWAIRLAPEPLATRNDCPEALIELSLGTTLESALVATACRTAIRNGVPLTLEEMQTLLTQWQQTHNPRTCPHGRPIYLSLEESSLARFFRRHWVIGKSHGI